MEPFVGQISMFGFNWAPRDWALCDGSSLAVNQYQALYSLLGNAYGGNTTSFNLPDLRGRFPLCQGSGTGLSNRTLAQKAGVENTVLTANQLAAHTHSINLGAVTATTTVKAATEVGNTTTPTAGVYLATGKAGLTPASNYFNAAPASPVNLGGISTTVSASGATIAPTGGNQPMSLMNPFLVINFCIALAGFYPDRP